MLSRKRQPLLSGCGNADAEDALELSYSFAFLLQNRRNHAVDGTADLVAVQDELRALKFLLGDGNSVSLRLLVLLVALPGELGAAQFLGRDAGRGTPCSVLQKV